MNSLEELYNEIGKEESEEVYHPLPRKEIKENLHFSLGRTTSHIQEVIAKFEPSFKWSNETYELDRRRYYALAFAYLKETSEPSLLNILIWCKDRSVHIRAVNKVLNNALRKTREAAK